MDKILNEEFTGQVYKAALAFSTADRVSCRLSFVFQNHFTHGTQTMQSQSEYFCCSLLSADSHLNERHQVHRIPAEATGRVR